MFSSPPYPHILLYDQWQHLQDAIDHDSLTALFEQLPNRRMVYIRPWDLIISSQDDGVEFIYESDGSITKICNILQSINVVRYDGFRTRIEKKLRLIKDNYCSPAPYTCQNMASPNFGDEQAVSVPTSVKELGIPVELAEQAVEENPVSVSPASETDENMPPPKSGGKQADSVPPSVEQLGTLPALNSKPDYVPGSAMHIAPAKSPANIVPSLAAAMMDFRNLQYRRHVKHLVDYTDVASMGGNTIGNMPTYFG